MYAIYGYVASILFACLAYFVRPFRMLIVSLSLILFCLSSGFIAATLPYGFGVAFAFFGLYQLFNIARLIEHRLHAKHLRKAFFIGGGRLLALQGIAYLGGVASNRLESLSLALGNILLLCQLVLATFILFMITRRMITSKPKDIDTFLSDKELPTVSVLIPARNEDENLVEVLRCVVANDYPKLEILVLDDCSANARIPEIVKDFAHDGVRFVQGDIPKDSWLPKNQAYETLADSSSGEWLLFMGVDVRLGTGSIRALVHYANNHQKSMLSIFPRRYDGTFWAGFFSPLRYFREMLRFSLWKSRVPALSTAWIIERKEYVGLGGIESVSRKVIPEHYFANKLSEFKKYAFVRTNNELRVSTAKNLSEQIKTSLRVIYPGSHGRIEWSALSSMFMFIFLFLPYIGLAHAIFFESLVVIIGYVLVVTMLTIAHLMIVLITNPVLWSLAIINFPYLVLQEIVLSFISMYRYEFGEVYWKERNICLPVMQAIPHLPKIDE